MRASPATVAILALVAMAFAAVVLLPTSHDPPVEEPERVPPPVQGVGEADDEMGPATRNLRWWDDVTGADVGLFNPAKGPTLDAANTELLESLGYLQGYERAEAQSGVVVHDPARAQPGYNLYVSGHAPAAVLIDMAGEVVHRWSYQHRNMCPERSNDHEPGQRWFRRALLLPGGELLVVFDYNAIAKLDRHSKLVWARCGLYHHDLAVDDRGRIFALTSTLRTVRRGRRMQNQIIDAIEVLDSGGSSIQRIPLWKAFAGTSYEGYLDRVQRPDVFHTNTIQVLDGSSSLDADGFRAGNLLISMRNIDTLATVDPAEGKISWALAGSWKAQHEPVLLDDGAILLFDNLGGERGSRVVEIDPRSGAVRWSYEGAEPGAFSSPVCGSNQRLANGNTLITESTAGRAFEVTESGEIVWDFRSPHRVQQEGVEMVALLGEVTRIDPDWVASWLR